MKASEERPNPAESRGIRVQKAMAQAGVASRREAERLMRHGQVRVNGQVTSELGHRLTPGDNLEVSGRSVDWNRARSAELWALYKPKRCVSTLDDPEGRACLRDFLPPSEERLFPIGRLDYDAEGLILLTNDGRLALHVAHPSFGVRRCYLVKVKGRVLAETLAQLAQGVVLGGRPRAPARARVLHNLSEKTWLDVTLREGINHHLKKMFAAVGHPVLKIKRYQIGAVDLGELKPGQYRKLGKAEMHRLLVSGQDEKAPAARPPLRLAHRRPARPTAAPELKAKPAPDRYARHTRRARRIEPGSRRGKAATPSRRTPRD